MQKIRKNKCSDQQEFCGGYFGDFMTISCIKLINMFLFTNSCELDLSGSSNTLNTFEKKNPNWIGTNAMILLCMSLKAVTINHCSIYVCFLIISGIGKNRMFVLTLILFGISKETIPRQSFKEVQNLTQTDMMNLHKNTLTKGIC